MDKKNVIFFKTPIIWLASNELSSQNQSESWNPGSKKTHSAPRTSANLENLMASWV